MDKRVMNVIEIGLAVDVSVALNERVLALLTRKGIDVNILTSDICVCAHPLAQSVCVCEREKERERERERESASVCVEECVSSMKLTFISQSQA